MSSVNTSKGMPTWLFTGIGVAAVAGIAGVANIIARQVPIQVDMTANKFYSLSPGTKGILGKLDTNVNATLFVSDSSEELPPQLVGRVRDVENLLLQFEKKAKDGNLTFKKVVPAVATDEEDQARLAGVNARRTPQGQIYFGISLNCLDRNQVIEFVPDIPEEQLEYQIASAITNVYNPKKKVVGLMSALPIAGGMGNPMTGGMGGSRPWVLHQQLSQNYEVKTVDMTVDKIDDSIDVLLLIHPAGITETAEYAVDQFLMKGKRVVAMLDPECVVADSGQRNPMMGGGGQSSSTLNKLLSHWGYSFDSSQVVADINYKTRMGRGGTNPGVLTLPEKAINEKSIATGKMSDITLVLAGGFSGKAADGLTEEWMLKSSPDNQLVSGYQLKQEQSDVEAKFKSSGTERYLALSLTGKFKSAFTEKPKKEEAKPGDKPEEKKEESKPEDHLKESKEDTAVILIGDVDFTADQFCVQMVGPGMAVPFNNNLSLAFNLVDYMAGDTNLIQIRSRASSRRPFTKINEIEEAANKKIRTEVENLQKKADDAQQRLTELQTKKDPKNKMMLSPEQQNEIKQFQKDQVDANKQIRQKQKDAMKEIESTKTWIKFGNIAVMPVIVLALGVIIAIANRRKHSAR